ncbi:MAG TPA: hypothetical protein VG406_04270 [Isosphaeraceae bacterium]|jgi:hypothetical protein|nr:hypothetical protein [Isosphaeraceae bacterium]
MSSRDDFPRRLALGAAAGLAGTVLLQALRAVNQRVAPRTMPPIRHDPGPFMVERAEGALPEGLRRRIPEGVESAASRGLGVGYGLTFGALYAALRPRGGPALADGVALGLATWAAGYLGWLPALGLMPPVWRQHAGQVALPVAQHAAFGVATVAAYDALRRASGAVAPHDRPGAPSSRTIAASSAT